MAILIALTISSSAGAQPYPDSLTKSQLIAVQVLLLSEAFDSASAIAVSMSHSRSDDPSGYLCGAATILARSLDREQEHSRDLFMAYLDTTESLAKNRLVQCPAQEAAWMELFRGLVLSYRSLWEARFGSSLKAIRTAFRAEDRFQAGWTADSSCYDLLFGLGTYHYWKSVKAGLLRSLGLFSDDTELGIAELHLAADSAIVFGDAARNALIWVWIDRRQYDSAITACQQLRTRYPQGKTFLWPLARANYESGATAAAVIVYKDLRLALMRDLGNHYNLIECDFGLAQCYEEMVDMKMLRQTGREAREYLDLAPSDVVHRQRDKIAYLKRAARM